MARPPLPIGERGNIKRTQLPDGTWQALCRYRDVDGVTRQVTARGTSGQKAENRLKEKLKDRAVGGDITPETKVAVLAELWYAHKLEEHLAYRTTERQRQILDAHILKAVGELRVREATTARLDRVVKEITRRIGAPTGILVKGVLSGIFGLAARYDAVATNPVAEVETPKVEASAIRALNVGEFHAMRVHAARALAPRTAEDRLVATGDRRRMGGRNRSSTPLDVIDSLIATGARPSEVLAIRWADLDLGSETPTVTLRAVVLRKKGEGLVIQEHTKSKDVRHLALPAFAVAMFMRRQTEAVPNKWDVVFASAANTLIDPRNMRKQWERTFQESEFAWVTAKTLRKTVATLIDAERGSEVAAKQLGHKSDEMTKRYYIEASRLPVDQRDVLNAFSNQVNGNSTESDGDV